MEQLAVRDKASDAICFWEHQRALYNLVLTTVVVAHFVAAYPVSLRALSFDFCLSLFALAVVANIAYCVAYLADIFVQFSGFRESWKRYRWLLFAIGTTFAAIITHFVSRVMFFRNV